MLWSGREGTTRRRRGGISAFIPHQSTTYLSLRQWPHPISVAEPSQARPVRLYDYITSVTQPPQIRVQGEQLRATIVVFDDGRVRGIDGSTRHLRLGEMEHRRPEKDEVQFIDLAMPSLNTVM